MELPFALRTLPPEALDILRYYGANGTAAVHADDIIAGAGLTDRGFGKAIRRLVTKGLIVMDGDQVYRLSEAGRRGVAELLEYDLTTPPDERETPPQREPETRLVQRRLVVAAPLPLAAGQPAQIVVGVDNASDEDIVMLPLHLTLRLETVHADIDGDAERSFAIENRPGQHVFHLTPGPYRTMRLRLRVAQSVSAGEPERDCGGLFVDLPVGHIAGAPAAYGGAILLQDTSGDSFDFA